MLHYFVYVWNAAADEAARRLVRACRQTHPQFAATFEADGVTVLCSGSRPQVLPDSHGVILGTLFRNRRILDGAESFERAVISEPTARRMVEGCAEELIREYWGDYVAVLYDRRLGSVHVLRGPASPLSCLHVNAEEVDVYFSSLELYVQFAPRRLSIDWQHLARSLLAPQAGSQTDVCEVTEILPGHSERFRQGRREHLVLWDTGSLPTRPELNDWTQAATALRRVSGACATAWADLHDCVLHALSGGLDSSVTLACLAPTRARVVCLTQYGDDLDSDERPYARLAARHLGRELVEARRDANLDFETALHSVRLPRCSGLRLPAIDGIEPELAWRCGATAIFRGDGGDELFCRNLLPLYVLDYMYENGFGADLMGLVVHAAASEGVTAWEVLARVALSRIRRPRFSFGTLVTQDVERTTLLKKEAVRELVSKDAAAAIFTKRPGRAWQASLLRAPRTFAGPFSRDDDAPHIAPLLSQPLIELCLSIPTYFQMRHRRDRALARAAFAPDLPTQIIERRDKGDAEQLARAMLLRNLQFTRELLLDGLVVRQEFVDRSRLEAALSSRPSADAVPSVPLFCLLGAEIFARAWCGGSLRR